MFLFAKFRWSACWSLLAIAGSVGILVGTTVYFDSMRTPVFLLEKGALRHHPLWKTAFYFHIIASCVCLAVGPFLMVLRLIRIRRFHSFVGYVYLNVVLWIAAPTGLILSPVSKAGWPAALGFLVTGALWWWTTWQGYRSLGQVDFRPHIRWMIRSYSVALSAVWFRVIHQLIAFGSPTVSDSSNYIASVWLSLLVSIWISEACLRRHFGRDRLALGRPTPSLVSH